MAAEGEHRVSAPRRSVHGISGSVHGVSRLVHGRAAGLAEAPVLGLGFPSPLHVVCKLLGLVQVRHAQIVRL